MKQFMYFQNGEEGMLFTVIQKPEDFEKVICMQANRRYRKDFQAMFAWMATAEVGEFYVYRLGVLVRLKDVPTS